MHETFINIAGITIKIKSKLEPEKETRLKFPYKPFLLKKKPAKVNIELELLTTPDFFKVDKTLLFESHRTPMQRKELSLFSRQEVGLRKYLSNEAQRYFGRKVVWRISRLSSGKLIEGVNHGGYQLFINKQLNKGRMYILSPDNRWTVDNVINNGALNILIVYYLSKRKLGVVFHSCGLKDRGNGYIFAGLSGAGKSTTSKIWGKLSSTRVISDDRIIVRKEKNKFVMYPTPWHGTYADKVKNVSSDIYLTKLFYIYHKRANLAKSISISRSFNLLYQAMFLPFWDKDCVDFISVYLLEIISSVPTYEFGFKNDGRIVSYIRNFSKRI